MKKRKVLEYLENALKGARMENCSFGEGTEEIVERTKLYRESWIIPQIEEAIRLIKGEKVQP